VSAKHNTVNTSSKARSFTPPTEEQVAEYAASQGNPIFNAPKFIEHYTKLEWHDVKGKPVKDWKARVRTWIARDNERREKRGEPALDGYSQYNTRPLTLEEAIAIEGESA